MAKWKPGDRVKIVSREVTKEDRQTSSYYGHLADLTGTVQNYYNKDEVAVKIDPEAFSPLLHDVHKEAVKRMRAKFLDSLGEEQRRKLTKEEKQFGANHVLLLHSDDLVKGPPAPKASKPVVEDDEDELADFDPTSVVQGALYDDPEVAFEERRKSQELDEIEEAELRRRQN